jgi:hypothetical protein
MKKVFLQEQKMTGIQQSLLHSLNQLKAGHHDYFRFSRLTKSTLKKAEGPTAQKSWSQYSGFVPADWIGCWSF